MQFFTLLSALVVIAVGPVSAAPALNNVQSNVAPYVGVADTNVGNTQGTVNGVIDGVDGRDRLGRRRRSPKTPSQPEFINSPQAATEGACNVGTAQCCQSLHQTSGLASQGMFGQLLAASIPLDQLMVGLQCSPIAGVIPIVGGSSSCNSRPVCCTGNKFDGLVSVGCSPLSLQ
ncbi:hypothetical protein M408DRAFT_328749 [Serendipita vermifera MAFF 305830]|uniref:Hydrophobin n=1 Tax=Serendipita vermifera MAFF 305830 TaxID=933852 RepID=A0A0C2XKC5_SERVB|nr:hypothetical protein M408DRAFT_328749 [Serendipita vermifera MAFF 305830]